MVVVLFVLVNSFYRQHLVVGAVVDDFFDGHYSSADWYSLVVVLGDVEFEVLVAVPLEMVVHPVHND